MTRGRPKTDPAERFWAKVVKRGADECWQWTAKPNNYGYGQFHGGGENLAHRFAYKLNGRTIPQGYVVDHTCHDPATCNPPEGEFCPHRLCVNPAHLEAKTQRENVRAGKVRRRETRVRNIRFDS